MEHASIQSFSHQELTPSRLHNIITNLPRLLMTILLFENMRLPHAKLEIGERKSEHVIEVML